MARLEPRDHAISLTTAAEYIRRHRAGAAGEMKAAAKGSEPNGGSFHADQVMKLLQQPGCTALRIYRARNAKNEATVVLVGVDANGQDMAKGVMLQEWLPCPPICDEASPLNG